MRILRAKSKLTQKQLAERIGVTQTYISRIERGEIEGLTIGKLLKLADALKVTPTTLLERLLNYKGG